MVRKVTGVKTEELPVLTKSESEQMLRMIKSGHKELREKFLLANARLVLSAVQRFRDAKQSPDELFQVGMIGLMKSLDNFDCSLDVRFSTYAIPMILGEIRRFIRESTAFKVGRNVRDVAYRAVKARESLEARGIHEANLNEIAAELDIPVAEVVGALDAISEPQSLYQEAFCDGEDSTVLVDLIKDPRAETDYAERIMLRDGVEALPEREKQVVVMRYYKGATQTEIARTLKMSQAQVSRLEKSAVNRLKECFEVGF